MRKARFRVGSGGPQLHVGSQSKNVENYLQALEISANIFNEAKEHDVPLKIMDIGGGFPIQHFDNEIGVNFDRMAFEIRKQIRLLFDKKVQFIAEPGRFLVGPAGILVTQVTGRAFRNNKNYYYLNDGFTAIFQGWSSITVKYDSKRPPPDVPERAAGPTCDSFDTPADVEIRNVNDVVHVKYGA